MFTVLDRSSHEPGVISHLVILWIQFGVQAITFRKLTQIRLGVHYSGNSFVVFMFTYFYMKEALYMSSAMSFSMSCKYVDGMFCYLSCIIDHSTIRV